MSILVLRGMIRVILAGVILAIPLAQAGAEEKLSLSVSTDRPDAIYAAGDEVCFQVKLSRGSESVKAGSVDYVLSEDGLNQLDAGPVDLSGQPVVIKGRMSQPGFLRCRVTFKTPEGKSLGAVAGAAVSPTQIEPSMSAPDDFDEFWNDQKAELAKVAINPRLTPVESRDDAIECFDVQLDCLGGAPVSGYFARPKVAQPKSLPAILYVHGAGVCSSNLENAASGAGHGMLAMDINAHGISNGKPASYYADVNRGQLNGYPHRGRESRETIYFRGMFLRLIRAIDFLASQPEWNVKTLAVVGHSQGGGQALAAGGLDDRVTFIGVGVPAICDHSGKVIGRINGWPKLVPDGEDGKPEPKILEAARYVDGVNMAGRVKAEAIMSIGFIDVTCPATTCYAAYNQLQGKKRAINEPLMGHAAPAHIQEAFMQAVLEHVGR